MDAGRNVCGNCANFKPGQGQKFFNCSFAKQAGVKYAMQVRADTRSCEAFSPLVKQPRPQPPIKATPTARAEPPRGGLCSWGRVILLAAIIIAILLLAWGAYTCYSGSGGTPTPTGTTGPPPTGIRPTPTPPPTPVPIDWFQLGEWADEPPWFMTVTSVETTTLYYAPAPIHAPAGTVFVIATVAVKNTSASYLAIQAGVFTVTDKFGFHYPPVQPQSLFYNPFPWFVTEVDPGALIGGRIVFVVPDVSTQLSIITGISGQLVAWVITY